MIRDSLLRRRLAALLVVVVALVGPNVLVAPVASAAPSSPSDDEGGTKSLTDQLSAASRGYLAAQDALTASQKRQKALAAQLVTLDAQLVAKQASVVELVRESYRTGRLGPMSAVLTADSPDGFLGRVTILDYLANRSDRALRELREAKTTQEQAKLAIDAEVRNEQKQVTVKALRKSQAENALRANGGGEETFTTRSTSKSAVATAAPRNSNGSLSDESCRVNDPTTSGCITPRTLNAMNAAKADGFDHFVSCFRPNGGGEHPKGRACDFAADKNGFGGVATGSSRAYGDRLAQYFIDNASRLGVMYVIWFRRIWLPSSGWRSYSRGNGDPASDHTNHVHLSMR